jgi:outer membrane protein assembly factor BamB
MSPGRGRILAAVLGAAAQLAACNPQAPPSPPPASTAAAPTAGNSAVPSSSAGTAAGPLFPGGLLIADRANDRLLVIDDAGTIVWRFPQRPDALPRGQKFSADDAFIDPDGRTIVANDEFHEVVDRIDIATGRLVWQYGRYNVVGAGPGELHTPDDAYPLANGNIDVADIENCRILQIAPDKSIARQWGRTGLCRDDPNGSTFARPNGDTPLADGGLLITEITGSRVVRLGADGHVIFDIHVPVAYPSDAQLDRNGNIVVADFSTHGQVVAVDSTGTIVWRYAPRAGPEALNHPSLATPLSNGLVSINDDFRHRIVVIDPVAGRIVWQYGRTDVFGTAPGLLNTPDGHEPLPTGIFMSP